MDEEQRIAQQEQRISKMAAIMIQSRKADEDVGELIAAALARAAEQLGSADKLVQGRPGSWEAAIVLKMAEAGGTANQWRVNRLAKLFEQMGKAGEDGGDILSQAMGEAVNTLGGLDQFAGGSWDWQWDMRNLGCQYSRYDIDGKLWEL